MSEPRMRDTIKTGAMLVVAFVIGAGGVALTRYADVDDSPGGMVIGWAITASAVVFGVRALFRQNV